MKILIWISAAFFIASSTFAKDFGRTGESFPVEEQSLLELIQSKAALQRPEMEKLAKEIEEYMQNPTPIGGIGKAIEQRITYYDPTYTVEEDIEAEGQLLARKGAKINPLAEMELPGGMLFFDGSDSEQVAWARQFPADFKWVLVKGSPITLETEEKRPVYFDQLGLFTSRFEIKNVPAKVTQEGTVLRVEEIPVEKKIGANEP